MTFLEVAAAYYAELGYDIKWLNNNTQVAAYKGQYDVEIEIDNILDSEIQITLYKGMQHIDSEVLDLNDPSCDPEQMLDLFNKLHEDYNKCTRSSK